MISITFKKVGLTFKSAKDILLSSKVRILPGFGVYRWARETCKYAYVSAEGCFGIYGVAKLLPNKRQLALVGHQGFEPRTNRL